MRKRLWLSFFCLWPTIAHGEDISSDYSYFDLEKTCREMAGEPDVENSSRWSCPGYKGEYSILHAVGDDRSFVGFGENAQESCAFRKTFTAFNEALSPVEWRLRKGEPFAVIERWRVSTDDAGGTATWLVVTKLDGQEACPVHYVEGAFPKANEEARRAADDRVRAFDCATSIPTVSTTNKPPPIMLEACATPAAD